MENYAFEIVETARAIRREANKRAAVLGATKAQWRVLAWLKRQGDGARRRDESDRRAWRIHLTPAAAPMLVQLEEMGRIFNADMLAGISRADRETVLRVLGQMRANLDANPDRAEQELETA